VHLRRSPLHSGLHGNAPLARTSGASQSNRVRLQSRKRTAEFDDFEAVRRSKDAVADRRRLDHHVARVEDEGVSLLLVDNAHPARYTEDHLKAHLPQHKHSQGRQRALGYSIALQRARAPPGGPGSHLAV